MTLDARSPRSRRPGAGPRVLHRPPRRQFRLLSLNPRGATIGALVEGVDLRQPCGDELLAELKTALADWKVLFFRRQDLTLEEQGRFAARWGRLTDDTLAPTSAARPADNVVVFTRDAETAALENEWHADGTFRPMPTLGTVLRALEVPETGGDTLFADMAAAFDNLPRATRDALRGLRAVHDWSLGAYAAKYGDRLAELRAAHPPVVHPVAIRHPETGRSTLFVNRLFTTQILGLAPVEGDALLEALCAMADLPELQVRWHWEPGSVALWDNIACNHYGANDYFPQRRVMARATFFSTAHDRLEPALG